MIFDRTDMDIRNEALRNPLWEEYVPSHLRPPGVSSSSIDNSILRSGTTMMTCFEDYAQDFFQQPFRRVRMQTPGQRASSRKETSQEYVQRLLPSMLPHMV